MKAVNSMPCETPSFTRSQGKPFVFEEQALEQLSHFLKKYPNEHPRSAILPLLHLAQQQCGGWLPQEALEEVGRVLGLPSINVLEVATFYTMFHLAPVGRYHLQVCGTTPCWLRGAKDLWDVCEEELGLSPYQEEEKPHTRCSQDGVLSLQEVECLGACVHAPVIQLGETYLENMTPEKLRALLKDLKTKKDLCIIGIERDKLL